SKTSTLTRMLDFAVDVHEKNVPRPPEVTTPETEKTCAAGWPWSGGMGLFAMPARAVAAAAIATTTKSFLMADPPCRRASVCKVRPRMAGRRHGADVAARDGGDRAVRAARRNHVRRTAGHAADAVPDDEARRCRAVDDHAGRDAGQLIAVDERAPAAEDRDAGLCVRDVVLLDGAARAAHRDRGPRRVADVVLGDDAPRADVDPADVDEPVPDQHAAGLDREPRAGVVHREVVFHHGVAGGEEAAAVAVQVRALLDDPVPPDADERAMTAPDVAVEHDAAVAERARARRRAGRIRRRIAGVEAALLDGAVGRVPEVDAGALPALEARVVDADAPLRRRRPDAREGPRHAEEDEAVALELDVIGRDFDRRLPRLSRDVRGEIVDARRGDHVLRGRRSGKALDRHARLAEAGVRPRDLVVDLLQRLPRRRGPVRRSRARIRGLRDARERARAGDPQPREHHATTIGVPRHATPLCWRGTVRGPQAGLQAKNAGDGAAFRGSGQDQSGRTASLRAIDARSPTRATQAHTAGCRDASSGSWTSGYIATRGKTDRSAIE